MILEYHEFVSIIAFLLLLKYMYIPQVMVGVKQRGTSDRAGLRSWICYTPAMFSMAVASQSL